MPLPCRAVRAISKLDGRSLICGVALLNIGMAIIWIIIYKMQLKPIGRVLPSAKKLGCHWSKSKPIPIAEGAGSWLDGVCRRLEAVCGL